MLYVDYNTAQPRFAGGQSYYSREVPVDPRLEFRILTLQKITDRINSLAGLFAREIVPAAQMSQALEELWADVVTETARLHGGASAEPQPRSPDTEAATKQPSQKASGKKA